ncbi:hypothetical protein ACJMK2_003622 [Sinanodonta woodiana]|uniref:Uncharacterized protein n=1 Tax=Sinanodonta woodiana TaxID=1069815 RepID=A0ABD3XYL5_SINWO
MTNLTVVMLLLVICAVTLSAELGKRSSDMDDVETFLEVLRNAIRREKGNANDFLDTNSVGSNRRAIADWW